MEDLTLEHLKAELQRLKACMNDHGRLGLPTTADRREVRRGFKLAARPYHPDLHRGESEEFQNLIQEIYMQLSEAEGRLQSILRGGPVVTVPPALSKSQPAAPKKPVPTDPGALGRAAKAPARSSEGPSGSTPDALLRRLGIDPSKPSTPRRTSTLSGRTSTSASKPTASTPSPSTAAKPTTSVPTGQAASVEPTPKVSAPATPVDKDEATFNSARRMFDRGAYSSAATKLVRLVKSRPDSKKYQVMYELARGHARKQVGDHDTAALHFHRAAVIDEQSQEAWDAIKEMNLPADAEERLLEKLLDG